MADELESSGLITSSSLFSLYLSTFSDSDSPIKPGEHLLPDSLRARELVACLRRATGCPTTKVTFPEGFNRFDMARTLQKKGVLSESAFLAATTDAGLLRELQIPAESAEGYLFPATYTFSYDADAKSTVRAMKAELDRRLIKIATQVPNIPGEAAQSLGWGWHEVLTLASMVEKEAAVDDERSLIASVFLNRFRDPNFQPKPPFLQSDPTAGYGCLVFPSTIPSCQGYAGKPTAAIVHDPSNRYSTYVHAGLPPGPIANPGERSIQAVVQPAGTGYLFFVAKGGGRHTFTSSLAEHNEAVRKLKESKR